MRVGPVADNPVPEWLGAYGGQHVAWVRLLAGDESLGLMLLVRRAPQPFVRAEEKELTAIAHRLTLAIENGVLHRRMSEQLVRLHRLQELTTELTGMLDLESVGRRVAEVVVSEVPATSCVISVGEATESRIVSRAGSDDGGGAERFPLEAAGKPVGAVQLTGAPAEGSEERDLLLHVLGLAALALDKALLYEHSREQARHDSLTGLLAHRVFQEVIAGQLAVRDVFSVALIDIDDFKQINDLHGHHAGDEALRRVADSLAESTRTGDSLFRIGGEEFCAVLPGLDHDDAYLVAERMRQAVADMVSALPVTVSVGVASYPARGNARAELIASADQALYASKRGGKNKTTIAGAHDAGAKPVTDTSTGLELLQAKDPDTVAHSVQVATLAVDIARALGMAEDRLAELRTAAKLHDIGKIAVPHAILMKPGPLDEDEFRIVETHPLVGAELLVAWGLPGPARFVLQHHERMDGNGYPHGLAADEIALESRIIHAADAYVAMTLDRPYRAGCTSVEALAELVRHQGTQFDAEVVDALLALKSPALTATARHERVEDTIAAGATPV